MPVSNFFLSICKLHSLGRDHTVAALPRLSSRVLVLEVYPEFTVSAHLFACLQDQCNTNILVGLPFKVRVQESSACSTLPCSVIIFFPLGRVVRKWILQALTDKLQASKTPT